MTQAELVEALRQKAGDPAAVRDLVRTLPDLDVELIVPEYDPCGRQEYPGDIKPGTYAWPALKELLFAKASWAGAIEFIADMLEE
ncbi:MAG: hypothetical protein HY680_10540 [Chloroflexi bacterium]|nr:hypothetical protein [Chloroflexota bacterium]